MCFDFLGKNGLEFIIFFVSHRIYIRNRSWYKRKLFENFKKYNLTEVAYKVISLKQEEMKQVRCKHHLAYTS